MFVYRSMHLCTYNIMIVCICICLYIEQHGNNNTTWMQEILYYPATLYLTHPSFILHTTSISQQSVVHKMIAIEHCCWHWVSDMITEIANNNEWIENGCYAMQCYAMRCNVMQCDAGMKPNIQHRSSNLNHPTRETMIDDRLGL